MTNEDLLKNIDNKLSAIIILLADSRERSANNGDSDSIKTEILLKRAGLSVSQISGLFNKKVEAVKKTLQRGKK